MPDSSRATKRIVHALCSSDKICNQACTVFQHVLIGLLLLVSTGISCVEAGTYTAFGPASYQRQAGSPVAQSTQFSVLDPTGALYPQFL